MDLSGNPTFHPGILQSERRRPHRRRQISIADRRTSAWADRCNQPPTPGYIRLFDPPPPAARFDISFLWSRDFTLEEWVKKIEQCERDVSDNPIAAALRPPNYCADVRAIFAAAQRKRWLAYVVVRAWTQFVWRKRTQCNIDMIDMVPIPDGEAIFLTDTTHRHIFRFHRRDVFSNLLSNICMSDEMLPAPRIPTNPWTNSPLTFGQIVGICHQLVADYGRRGKCPPVLFAAFWAARFNLRRFQKENSAVLAQHAIASYFKDLHEENMLTVFDTITILLTSAQLDFSYMAIRRWLRQIPQTPLHREWLRMAQDYTLYINLHVQPRMHWISEDIIYSDVRRLYSRTILPESVPARVRVINGLTQPTTESMYVGVLGLPITAESSMHFLFDISGADTTALQLIQNALFR